MISLKLKTCLAMIGFLLQMPSVQADVFVIVNSNNSLEAMTADDINRIFLKKSKRFENGVNAEPVAQAEGSKSRASFNLKVLQRDEQQLKYYWSRKMFSGGDRPPPTVNSEADVIALVAEKTGAVGYVKTLPNDSRVKVVFQIRE